MIAPTLQPARTGNDTPDPARLWLPAREMLTAGAAANALGFWDDGCRLWRALFRQGAVGGIAAQGLAEAALWAGRFGLADHAMAHCGDHAPGLAEAVRDAGEIRARRKALYGERGRAFDGENTSCSQQLALRYYDEVLHGASERGRLIAPDAVMAAAEGIGRFDTVLEVAAKGADDSSSEIVDRARRRMRRWRDERDAAAATWLSNNGVDCGVAS